jgi:hypothetical protein
MHSWVTRTLKCWHSFEMSFVADAEGFDDTEGNAPGKAGVWRFTGVQSMQEEICQRSQEAQSVPGTRR